MKKKFTVFLSAFIFFVTSVIGQKNSPVDGKNYNDTLPVRGFAIAAPRPSGVDSFVTFIKKELIPRHVNTLILRVDYGYQFKSHPELIDSFALSEKEVKKSFVRVSKEI